MKSSGYIGRFAPSPTGRLHMGSLLAAVASWCDARHCGGTWFVRMEDLDPPREVKGAAEDILRTLSDFGLSWDGTVVKQSHRMGMYQEALDALERQDKVYPCCCSRRELVEYGAHPCPCRCGLPPGREGRLKRFKMEGHPVAWEDLILGELSMDPSTLGDFPVLRADGFWAYQLAVVVDDMQQGVTHVIRGADLLDSTPRQIQIWTALNSKSSSFAGLPDYGHLPLLQNSLGQKLSKQTCAQPVNEKEASSQILQVLSWLGQNTEDDVLLHWAREKKPAKVLVRAAELWRRSSVPGSSIQWQG